MKSVFVLFIATAACAANVLREPVHGYQEGDRYFIFTDSEEDTPQLVDTEEPADLEFINEYTRNPANNGYWLYTRLNPSIHQVLVFNDPKTVANSNFDSSKITVFLAHGLNGNGQDGFNKQLTEVLLEEDDVNVIVLDWSKLASRFYTTARNGTAAVGRGLGEFVNWLVTSFGLPYERCHLIGYSLGGHLVGNAGRATGGKVGRITGLDPAGPLWGIDRNRLSSTDAKYVEVIHTDTLVLGYAGRLGHADFYPNGGSNMPGCEPFQIGCSHARAVQYMASSVENNHLLANECVNRLEAASNRCRGSLNPMGNTNINKTRSGIFRVNTGRTYPY